MLQNFEVQQSEYTQPFIEVITRLEKQNTELKKQLDALLATKEPLATPQSAPPASAQASNPANFEFDASFSIDDILEGDPSAAAAT